MRIRIGLPFFILAVAASPAAGQSALTLEEAIARTLERNAAIRAVRAAEDEAAARVDQARAGYFPRVDVVEGWQKSNHPVFVFSSLLAQRQFTAADFALDQLNHPDAIDNHRAAVVVEQTLYDGSRTRAGVDGARLGQQIASLDAHRTAADLRLAVVRAYGRVLSAAAQHASARGAVEAAAEDLRRAEARRDAGIETEANVLALRVHAGEVSALQVRMAAEETVARAGLNALMGTPLDDAATLVDPGTLPPRAVDPTALEAAALTSRPELQQASLRAQQAQAGRTTARAGFLPQVVLQGSAEANGSSFAERESAWAAGVQVRWNVFAGGVDAGRVKEAAAAAARADAERARIEDAVRLDVRAAVAEYQSAVARERVARQMVDQARESQRMIRDRYETGLEPASELLRAAEAVLQADATRIAATIDVHVTSAALDRAVGTHGVRP
jgi:outer membrane protein TolC